ncbi:ATP-binding protein [uncultured Methylovirgula sp.]|uniref:ATP-binding protein n=1 Tax=uncultured Methylovirgula sp. TaxID=1285960 RepID=UPI002628CF32|nr:ATP-binding protein [uncultured Methylovirgula sp.]
MREALLSSAPERAPHLAGKDAADEAFTRQEAENARDRAEAASEAKSRLLATMSHEIRTPLNGILGLADLLAATALEPEQRAYVEAIRASGRSLAALVDEILDLSKIEAGKVTLTEAPFDLSLLVEGTIEILAPRAHAKGLDIASHIAADLPACVVGDAARLRQVLLNLAGNAVKFTTQGGVGLRVSRAAEAIKFAVIDTGPGVAGQNPNVIFEEFAQAAPREGSGTGLGLAISRQLAERMGGRLHLESTSPRGATFVLTLPLVGAASHEPAPERLDRRFLIVSPSPFEAPYLVEKLTELGAEAARAPTLKSGLAALANAAARTDRPQTVIVDCALGEAATLELSAAAEAAGVAQKLVLFTAAERRAFAPQALRTFDGWLVKPLRLRSLLARLGAAQAVPQPAVALAPLDLSGRKILLAEDNDINALVLQKHLERCGARLSRAGDGIAALSAARAALAEAPFDAMIVDLRMPRLDGLALARGIRRLETAAGAPRCLILAVTADAFAATKAQALAAGIDAFLTKPVDFAALETALTSLKKANR